MINSLRTVSAIPTPSTPSLAQWAGGSQPDKARVILAYTMTDIVGSTAINQDVGDIAWASCIGQHYANAEQFCRKQDGYTVKQVGDGVFCVFQNPDDALVFLDALSAEPGDDRFTLRATLHVGAAIVTGNDMAGISIAFAERLFEHAHPGFIAVSDIAKSLLQDDYAFSENGNVELPNFGEQHIWIRPFNSEAVARLHTPDGRSDPLGKPLTHEGEPS